MASFIAFVVGLPEPIKVAIAIGILFLVRLALAGRLPDELLTKIAAIISGALIALIELLLGLIPLEFEAIAAAILNLIAILLGTIFVVRAYLLVATKAKAAGIRF